MKSERITLRIEAEEKNILDFVRTNFGIPVSEFIFKSLRTELLKLDLTKEQQVIVEKNLREQEKREIRRLQMQNLSETFEVGRQLQVLQKFDKAYLPREKLAEQIELQVRYLKNCNDSHKLLGDYLHALELKRTSSDHWGACYDIAQELSR